TSTHVEVDHSALRPNAVLSRSLRGLTLLQNVYPSRLFSVSSLPVCSRFLFSRGRCAPRSAKRNTSGCNGELSAGVRTTT
ncbi:unnamed protein product, partial [Laminaria digitata]